MIGVEICIDCDSGQPVDEAVAAAFEGGAATVELCGTMACDGLTPTQKQVIAARRTFSTRPGLMVMIRPRSGGFFYGQHELATMRRQIAMVAAAGADGVVFGVLHECERRIDTAALQVLLATSAEFDLCVTFHRAFDAVADPFVALEILIDAGVDRILTSGTPWGKEKSAVDGIEPLRQIIASAAGRIEIVVGGGICASNIQDVFATLVPSRRRVSLHAHSGAQQGGITTVSAVQALVAAARPF